MSGCPDNKLEKLGLLILAGGAIITLAVIAIKAIVVGKIGSDVATLVGVIATGLIAFGKDIIQALRGYAMSAQLGKVTDQLAASGPPPTDTPQPVVVKQPPDEPVPVETQS